MGGGEHPLAQIGIPVQLFRQPGQVRGQSVDGGLLGLDPLQQPARRAEMGEAHLPVVQQPRLARRRQGRGHIHHMDIGIVLGQRRQGDIGEAEPVAMPQQAPLREAQGLDGGLGQVVDQDRGRGHRAQLLDHVPGRLQEEAGGGLARGGIHRVHEGMAGTQGPDQDQVVAAIDGHGDVVGKARRDLQVQPAALAFLPQEVLLHLHVAVAEQQHVQPVPRSGQALHRGGLGHRPVVLAAGALRPPPGLHHRGRVPPVGGPQLRRQGGQLGLRRQLGQHLPLQEGVQQGRAKALLEQGLGNLEQLDHLGEIGIHHPPHLVHRMQDQHPAVPHRGHVDEAGLAQGHSDRLRQTGDGSLAGRFHGAENRRPAARSPSTFPALAARSRAPSAS